MIDVFTRLSDFIDTDPRVIRPFNNAGYTVSNELQTYRNLALLPPNRIHGTKILDIGCCVAASGAWALEHGAERYVGIEAHPDLAIIARDNLQKHFPDRDWEIITQPAEEYLSQVSDKFDITVAAGVIYAITDTYGFMTRLAEISDSVVVESIQPRPFYKVDKDLLGDPRMSAKDSLSKMQVASTIIEFEYPFTYYRELGMVHGTEDETIQVLGTFPSIGALRFMMKYHGFEYDIDPYMQLKKTLPKLYNPAEGSRFAVRFDRTGVAKQGVFKDAIFSDDKVVVNDWFVTSDQHVFTDESDFITTDPRNSRENVFSYRVSAALQNARHTAFFKNINLKNAKVLDLGCCVAATAAWAFEKGAIQYTGLETDPVRAEHARQNLYTHYPHIQHEILETDADTFVENCQDRYDVIIAAGIIYFMKDARSFLKNLARISDNIIIDSRHPRITENRNLDLLIERLGKKKPLDIETLTELIALRKDLEYKQKFIEYDQPEGESIHAFVSIGAVEYLLAAEGYRADYTGYENLKTVFPENYSMHRRYLGVFKR